MRRHVFPALALAALAAFTLPASADAQRPRHEGGHAGAPAERIIELRQELGLTDTQVEQLERIQAQLQAQNEPLLAQLSAAREQMRAGQPQITDEQREQMRQRREAVRDSMRALRAEMTPEQREQARERMRAQMQERRAAGDARPRPGVGRAARAALPAELRPVMEQLRANTESAMQQIQSTLTAEQQQKLRELRAAPRHRGETAPRRQGESAPRG